MPDEHMYIHETSDKAEDAWLGGTACYRYGSEEILSSILGLAVPGDS